MNLGRTSLLRVGLVVLSSMGWGCAAPELDGVKWRCQQQSDCGSGYLCDNTNGFCVKGFDGENGVTANSITFGMSAAIGSGSDLAQVGNAAKQGTEACFAHFNSLGGINGRRLELVVKDDAYNKDMTIANITAMLGDSPSNRSIFALVGVLGSEPSLAAAQIAVDQSVLFFGPATGFEALEKDPPERYVFNVRPRYSQESSQLTTYLLKTLDPPTPKENIIVFGQGDDDGGKLDVFGQSGFAGVAGVLKTVGVTEKEVFTVTYDKKVPINVDVPISATLRWMANSNRIQSSGVTHVGVVMVSLALSAASYVRELQDQLATVRRGGVPNSKYGTFIQEELDRLKTVELRLTSLSTVDTGLADLFKAMGTFETRDSQGKTVTKPFGAGLIMAVPVPHYDSQSTGVKEYQEHLEKFQPGAERSFVSLEAYMTARLLVEGLRRHGRDITTESLIDTLESLEADLGIGVQLKFSKSDHQASSKLWGAQLNDKLDFEQTVVLVE
jgi:ABC-type branched-subunit amino acid transport system substrate-binding protein